MAQANEENQATPSKGISRWIANLVHIVSICALLLYTFYAVIADNGVTAQNFFGGVVKSLVAAKINDIFTFIGAIAFILFGIVGIYEFAYTNGLSKLLPPFYLKFREKHDEDTAKIMMKTYYEQDIEFIQQYEQERVVRILQALKITEPQFNHIRYEIVRARTMPHKTEVQMCDKLKEMIYREEFLIDLTKISADERVYPDVDYFIDLYSAFYDRRLCSDVGSIMASYIASCLKKRDLNVADIDYIVIPQGSNLLFGLEVGKLLERPVVAVRENPRAQKSKPWDGPYKSKQGDKNRIIILHDVLVTGKRIYESVEKLIPDTYVVEGLFCLIQYASLTPEYELALTQHGIQNIHCLLKTDENELKEIIQNSGAKGGSHP